MKEYSDCRVEERLHTPAQDSLFEYRKIISMSTKMPFMNLKHRVQSILLK